MKSALSFGLRDYSVSAYAPSALIEEISRDLSPWSFVFTERLIVLLLRQKIVKTFIFQCTSSTYIVCGNIHFSLGLSRFLNSEVSSDLPRLYTMKIKMQYTNFSHFLYCKPFAILKFLSCAFDEYFLHTYDTDMIYIFFVATLISSNFNRKSISILVS